MVVALLMAPAKPVWSSSRAQKECCHFCTLFEQQAHSKKVAYHQSNIVDFSILLMVGARDAISHLDRHGGCIVLGHKVRTAV